MNKRLEKALPIKSNLTAEEQIYFIKKTFNFMIDIEKKSIFFNKTYYSGEQGINYGYFIEEEKDEKKSYIKLNPIPESVITAETLLKIIDYLSILKFNRVFSININVNESNIKDPISKKENKFNNIIYFSEKTSFKINSMFLYIFRLNNKTFLKKTYIYIFNDYLLIEQIRKRKKILFYIKIG